MSTFKFILAATDFSAPAHNAVSRAAMLANEHGARLRIMHVVPQSQARVLQRLTAGSDTGSKVADAHAALRRLAAEISSRYGVTPDIEVRAGDAVEELNRSAGHADLLVIGCGRRHSLARLVLGQTRQRLVAHCGRPVLVVKQCAERSYRRALMPIDFSPASDAAAEVAAALARRIDLQVFHALDATGEVMLREADVSETVIRACRLHQESALTARMHRSMHRFGLDSDKLSFAFGRGSSLKATLRQAQGFGADVVIAATHRRGRFATIVLSDINRLLSGVRCDMLIVPGWAHDPRQQQALASGRNGVRAIGVGRWRTAHVPSAPGSSWMSAQLPAEALVSGQKGRPFRAGG